MLLNIETTYPFNKSKQNLAYSFVTALNGYIDEENEREVVESLIDLLPDATFDAVQPFDVGELVYNMPIFDDTVGAFIDDIRRVDLNLAKHLPINITLNSDGGGAHAGLLLIGAIQQIQMSGRKVNICVQGMAASMSSIVLQIADRRTMGPNAVLMLHEASSLSRGKLSSQSEDLAATKRLQDTLYGYYAARTGKSVDYYETKLKKTDLYLSAQQALDEGLVDAIISTPKYSVTPPKTVEPVKTRKRSVKNV